MNFNLNLKVEKVMELFAKYKSLRLMFYSMVWVAFIYSLARLLEVVRWWQVRGLSRIFEPNGVFMSAITLAQMAYLIMYKIIFTLLLCCCATAYGAEVENALLKKNLEAAMSQIEVLKAQNEVMKSYQDRFLNIVLWALGIVVTLFVFFASFNWFANNRNLAKESELHKEMIANELIRLQNEINNKISESLSATDDEFDKILEKLKANFMDTVSNEFETKIGLLKADVKLLKRKSIEDKFEEAMQKSVYTNAIRYACNLLDLSIDDYHFQDNTSNALSKIETTLRKVKDEGKITSIKPNVVAQLTASLTPFEDKHSIVIKRIHQQLSEFS